MRVPETLCQALRENRKGKGSVTYVEGADLEHQVSFAELYERALGILHHLQKWGLRPGDELILFLQSNEAFLDAFWACLLGRIVPVPVALGHSEYHRQKLLQIFSTLQHPHLYCEENTLDRLAVFLDETNRSHFYAGLRERSFCWDWITDLGRAGQPHPAAPGDLAFIQFSSGSTREPKGVLLTHENVMANIDAILKAGRFTPEDVSLSWMPLTHDMGLIGFHLNMLVGRISHYLMPTELFVRRPLLWLEVASRTRATVLCSPNFGYRHFLRVWEERGLPGDTDLSRVRLIFNGAEPISVPLCREFLDKMAAYGLKRSSMFTVYGLAEASLAVTFPECGREFRSVSVSRSCLGIGQTVKAVPEGAEEAVSFAVVGKPIPHCRLRIVDDQGRTLPEGVVGHIQIAGRNVTRGYYGVARDDALVFVDETWVNTGDLGFLEQGELVVTGRFKEIIFSNGQNFYPHDLEELLLEIPDLDLGKVVVAGARVPGGEADEVVVFVLFRKPMEEFVELAGRIIHTLSRKAGLTVEEVIPVRRIPKTTSGKIQRHLLVQAFLQGEFQSEREALAALRAQRRTSKEALSRERIEAQLLEICRKVLSNREIGREDNLFEAGTSSLQLVRIHQGIEELFPGQVDVTELFDYPSVVSLAAYLEGKLKEALPT